MRRTTLSAKLFIAAVPLLIAVGALLVITVMSDLNKVQSAEDGAQIGALWSPMLDTFSALDTERDAAIEVLAGTAPDLEAFDAAGAQTDAAFKTLDAALQEVGDDPAAAAHIVSTRSALGAARRNTQMRSSSMASSTDPLDAYGTANAELVALGRLLPPAAGDTTLGRELYAVVKIAETNLASNSVITDVIQWQADPTDRDELISARNSLIQIDASLAEFETVAPAEWASQYRQSGLTTGFAGFRIELDRALQADAEVMTIDTAAFSELVTSGTDFQREISNSSVLRAQAEADAVRSDSLIRIGIILGAVLIAGLAAWAINRSITRRIKAVAANANQVADEQLPALVEAIRDPRGGKLPQVESLSVKGRDELADLATAFNSMQRTLVEVAEEQTAVLRRGVSDIFITMARRNRSLVDRQLAMLDEFESSIDDPAVLSNFYDLDHLATRMRRNSESLLVLASAEPRRRQIPATSIDDVVRASIGEVEDYRRIAVEALDQLDVRGQVVADISHMLAELLDNATSFSPPESTVQIGGRRTDDGYLIRVHDSGLGIGAGRLLELNEVLTHPPIVGLSVEPTLGISVVSLLAKKHGIKVTLKQADPGTTVDIVLPASVFAPVAQAESAPAADADVAAADIAAAVAPLRVDTPVDPTNPRGTVAPTPVAASPTPPSGLRIDESFVAATPAEPVAEAESYEFDFHMADTSSSEAAEPVVEPVVEPVAEAPIELDVRPVEQPTQLDRPAISSRLTDAFARSELGSEQMPAAESTPAPVVAEPQISIPQVETPAVDVPPISIPQVEAPRVEAPVASFAQPQLDAQPAAHMPPPPVLARPVLAHPGGEFHRPPAPPRSANGATSQPVAPAHAHPAPEPVDTRGSDLPVRLPKRDVDGGPDRLQPASPEPLEPAEDLDAVQAAIAAFDQRQDVSVAHAGAPEAPEALPTRSRTAVRVHEPQADQPESTTSSHLDPAELRSRLRSFQNEFRTGQVAKPELPSTNNDPSENR